MKNLRKFYAMLLAVSVFFVTSIFAEKTPVENLYQYQLDNGLTVFIAENHAVPLAYIEIAVRAGAITQTPENAGLFHLYEHMMFKGNDLYPDAASVNKALSDMGVSNWNGTTGTDRVNYFFTIPSDQLEKGLAFWNAAIRSPLMNPKEFEAEKKVVLAEIEGDYSDPGSWYYDYYKSHMFPDAPYRLDPAGSSPVVKNATVAQMRDMQSKYYIPSNAALFIGGDVSPDETIELVKKIYGTWSNNGNKVPEKGKQQNVNPFDSVKIAVLPYDKISPQIANVTVALRGPDTDFDIEDTYTADYLLQLLEDPNGTFAQTLVNTKELDIPDVDYVDGGYGTQRASGSITFSATMLNPADNIVDRAKLLASTIQDNILPSIASDKSLYSKAKVKDIVRSLEDDDLVTAQTASGLLSNLSFWWVCSSPEYYYTYNDKLSKVTKADMQKFVEKYITGKSPLILIEVNPDIYEKTKDAFVAAGVEEITSDNCTWWKEEKFAPDPAKIALENGTVEKSEIYVPEEKAVSNDNKKKLSSDITIVTLSNGIPVYIQNEKASRINAVAISFKGGVEHLTEETSGLESALFSMMASSSKKYNYAKRQSLEFYTGASIGSYSMVSGSAISLGSIDSYFDKMLPVLLDGVMNPSYEQLVYDNMMTSYNQSLQSMQNSPTSLLSYELSKTVYKGHPYAVSSGVRPESINNITIDNMKDLYKKIMNPSTMFVVAVGNINQKKLVSALNKTIGKLKATSDKYVAKAVPELKISGDNVVLTHPSAQGSGYVARIFAAPSSDSVDYIPATLAASIYSDVMFNVIREHYGACYTPTSYVVGSRAPLGYEYLFKVSDVSNFYKYMKEARDYMAEDKLIESVNEDGSYNVSDIESRIEGYKNSSINSTYESQATTAGIAGNLVYNVMQFDDISYDVKQLEQLKATTADDVLKVFNKYWVNAASRTFVMVGPDDADKVNF
ncbi:MAG: insulinase family protein [Treponema sp.]|nr:insulinase family protein [Treponema sp.]